MSALNLALPDWLLLTVVVETYRSGYLPELLQRPLLLAELYSKIRGIAAI